MSAIPPESDVAVANGSTPELADLVPVSVHVEQTVHDFPEECLFPAEAQQIRDAVPARRQEFTAVRVCARRALARVGCAASPLLNGVHREPLWPAGVRGSLTHCPGYRAAAVARATDIAALGIDAEVHQPLPDEIRDDVMLPEEQFAINDLRSRIPGIAWDRLSFSAKESVFKAWFPTARRWAEFNECQISFDAEERSFTAHLLTDPLYMSGRPVTVIGGRWAVSDTHVVTAVCVRYPRRAP